MVFGFSEVPTITRFEDLVIWQIARTLNMEVYRHIQEEPFSKDYPLKDQINRASGSIMDNIAEGFGRQGNKEFVNFLTMAKGSCLELKSQVYRATDRGYIPDEMSKQLLDQIQQLDNQIGGFINYLKNSGIKGQKFKEPDEKYGLE